MVLSEVLTFYYCKLHEVVSIVLFQVSKVFPKVVSYLPRGSYRLAEVMFPCEDCQ